MTTTKKNTESKPPVARIRVGSVTASIWENQTEKGKRYSATYQQRYKDDEGKWQSSHSFGGTASLFLSKAADLARDRMEALGALDAASAEDDGPYIDDEAAA
jgi:hypothetical protein